MNANGTTAVPVADQLDRAIRWSGYALCWVFALLIVVIILQVVLRYGFGHGLVMLEELQWHLYAVGVMFGVAYAQVQDAHVRVDLMHMRFSRRTQRLVEIVGIVVFLLPFVWVVFYSSIDFVAESYRVAERSDAPLGLPYRWLIKSTIPAAFGLLGLAALSRLWRDLYLLITER